jgi:hypothetical protein
MVDQLRSTAMKERNEFERTQMNGMPRAKGQRRQERKTDYQIETWWWII